MKRALILGGGGVVGVAWHSGLIAGLKEGGVDLSLADIIVGTSAGSYVGAKLAAGHSFESEFETSSAVEETDQVLAEMNSNLDMESMIKVFKIWMQQETMSQACLQTIGGLAKVAKTMDEALWIMGSGSATEVDDWPDVDLRITTVDVDSGELVIHTKHNEAPLHHAVAASCSIPGVFPPITIGSAQFMDGGIRSGTNADLVLDDKPDVAMIIAPICEQTAVFGALAERTMNQEVEQLKSQGTKVITVLPSQTEIAIFGNNLLDATRRDAARKAGYERGLQLAEGDAVPWV